MVYVIEQQIVSVTFWPEDPLRTCASAARTCYQSQSKPDETEFIRKLIEMGHESVIEHAGMTAKLITDRGVTHELVRHRLASYSQESTRYCNYKKKNFTVIIPEGMDPNSEEWKIIREACEVTEQAYLKLLEKGIAPQIARAVLPTCLKTEIVVTANLREWRHIFSLRCDKAAHPQIRKLMTDLLHLAWKRLPWAFFDLAEKFLFKPKEQDTTECTCH